MLIESGMRAGQTLADEIARGPLAADRVVTIARAVLDAVGAAHDHGVLHGDLSPSRVVITSDTDVVICEGSAVPAVAYLAPERLAGEQPTVRSDIYSVGVLCYEAITGVRPFQGASSVETAYATSCSSFRPIRTLRPEIAAELEAVISRAMARLPDERFASAGELADALEDASVVHDAPESPARPLAEETDEVLGQRSRVSNHASARPHASFAQSG